MVVLGLGLGAATVMLSMINAVFVRPLPFPEPDRIVSVVRYRSSGPTNVHSQAAVALTRDHSRAFSALAGIGVSPGVNLASDRGSAYVRNLEVTAGFFRVLGVEPQLGRAFARDDEPDPSTVVLSHAVWAGHFGGDPASSARTCGSAAGRTPSSGSCRPTSGRTRRPRRGRRSVRTPAAWT